MRTFLIIVIVVLVLVIGVGAFFIVKEFISPTQPAASASPSTSVSASASAAASGSSDLQSAYDAAQDIEASTTKAKTVDGEVKSILKNIFANNVKLKEDMSGSLLTYITNREVTAADVTAFKAQMEAAGYKTLDSSDKQLTLSKGANTLVFTFPVGDNTKATIDMTL
jgi:cytoskeletal protein RodZ